MEWRIVVPLLCLIGILHVPGNAAETSNSTNMNTTDAPTTAAPVATFNLTFRLLQNFSNSLSDLTTSESQSLINNITTAFTPIYQSHFPNFLRMTIRKFSQGSIVVDSVLEFNATNGTSPNVTNIKDTFVKAIASGNVSLSVDNTSISAVPETTAPPPAPTPATNTTASPAVNVTATSATNTTASPAVNVTATSATNTTASPAVNVTATSATNTTASPAVNVTATSATNTTASPAVNVTATSATNTTASPAVNVTASTATKSTDAPTTTAPIAKVNLGFSIRQNFSEVFSNLSHPETKSLITNITNEFTPFYKKNFPDFKSMTIRKFSKGSIVVDSVLEFNATNGTSPNVTNIKDTFVKAIASGNFSFPVDNTSISAVPETTASPPAPTPATNTTASPAVNVTATSATNTTASPAVNVTASTATKSTDAPTTTAPIARVNLGFSIRQNFSEVFSNLSHPETKSLITNITNELSPFYKRRFPNFIQMIIQKFSKGSIVVDSTLEFNTTNGTSPNETDTKAILVDAIQNGNLSFSVDNTSISASVVADNGTTTAKASTTAQATTVSAASRLTEFNIAFKMNEVFTSDLSNILSDAAIKLAKNITTELDGYFKTFPNFNRTLVWRFRNGSIDVDGLIGFNANTNTPSVSNLATGLADAVRKGIVKLSIDPKSIKVTDSSGVVANRSPVLASMLTALWMTLASLLLSAVMH